jgi:septal ring factor EnvC (AmiA/AmiB activator)
MPIKQRLIPFFAALLLLCPGGPALAADSRYELEAEKLRQLRGRIEEIKKSLKQDRVRLGGVSGELRAIDEKVGRISARLRRLDERASEKSARISVLRKELAVQQERMLAHRRHLSRQLMAAYAGGRQSFLKLLLNQEDPAQVDRMLTYHRYFNRARMGGINEATAQLRRLAAIESSLQEELDGLAELRQQQQSEQQELIAARAEREAALAALDAAIAAKGEQLSQLSQDEHQLQRLLDELRNALADIPELKRDQLAFKSSRGRLPWPLQGTLAARFGEARGIGDARWSGLLIEAAAGSKVHAVSAGHVVFADWLRGFGLLLIVDHGDGFMTLYGHNEAIYKEAGDWVQTGEVIATVGASGGRYQAGLYFEIRAGGKPVDPVDWLSKRRS